MQQVPVTLALGRLRAAWEMLPQNQTKPIQTQASK